MKSLGSRLICVVTLVMCATTFAAEVPAPVRVPYAPDRKLLQTEFLRLDWNDTARKRQVPVKIYYPADANGPFPVILFSHGLGGTRENYEYLARQWSANGYVCVHMQHIGSDDSAWRGQDRPMQSMRQAANAQNSIDRAKDVSFALDQLEAVNASNDKLKGRMNLKEIGIAGHSFGANTTLLAAGQAFGMKRSTEYADPRIKCAIPMSAPVPVARGDLDAVYAKVTMPTFHMTGTKDDSPIGETSAAERRIPYDHIKSNALLLIFKDGDHMVFSGRLAPRPGDVEIQELIRVSSTAFWDANLKSDAPAKTWLYDGAFKKMLDSAGTFEQK